MSDNDTNTVIQTKPKIKRPRLYKVMLENDDFTPREFVVKVLKSVFRMTDDEAYVVMMAAHQQGNAVVSVYTRDVAESKAKEATDMGREAGHPLMFTIEPEE
jgi:ATP-dependent Clp protease adaptor protein ClpS